MRNHDHPSPNYDIIGDIHGELGSLKRLLIDLGYREGDSAYFHPDGRIAVFVGDLIDRGPDSRSVLHLVRSMIEAGSALMTMGNHEFNFVSYHIEDGNGGHLRPHTPRNDRMVAATLASFEGYEAELPGFIDWMRGLPFFLELDGLRVVHASWIDADIDFLHGNSLTDDAFLADTARKEGRAYAAIENVLKGVEIKLPDRITFVVDGTEKTDLRVRWWETLGGRTWREIGFPERAEYPLDLITLDDGSDLTGYDVDMPPVLFGHYKLTNETPRLEAPNVATLDYGLGHGGPATAYRWSGEEQLSAKNFEQTSLADPQPESDTNHG